MHPLFHQNDMTQASKVKRGMGDLFVKQFYRIILLSFILSILLPQSAKAQDVDQSAGILVLKEDQEIYPLGRYLEILRDSSGELTIEDVSSKAFQDQFFSSQVETPNFGYQDVPYWVRFRVQNQDETSSEWFLVLGFRNMHYMDLYVPDPNGGTYSVIKSGVLRAQENPSILFDKLSFNLEIPPGETQTFYIRFQNEASMTLPLTLMTPEAFARHVLVDQLGSGAFYGILLIMVVYNTILYALIREKAYLHLVLFSLTAIVFFVLYHPILFRVIPNISPELATGAISVVMGFFLITLVMFVDSYLDLKNALPKIHVAANIIMFVTLLTSIAAIFVQYRVITTIQLIIIILSLTAILAVNLFLSWGGNRSANLLLGSLSVFLIGAVLGALARLGIIPSNIITEEFFRFGLIWMVAFWSLALADRMNRLITAGESARREIADNERRLAQYLDSMPVGVVVYDADLKLRYINQQSEKLLNQQMGDISPDKILNSTIEDAINFYAFKILGTDTPYPIKQLPIVQAIQQGKAGYVDNIELDLGTHKIPLEVWTNPLMDASGNISGTVVAFQNIQERLDQEERLRRSEEFRQKILQGSSIGTWMTDLVSDEVRWDSRTREIFGLAPDEPATLEIGFDLIHPQDRKHAQKAFQMAISPNSNGSYEEEKRIIRPDGQVRWISTRGNVIYEEAKGERQAIRMVGVVIDITQQKQAEKELEESRFQYRNLVENMNEGLAIVDENLILTYVNPRLPEMLGYTQEDMIGKHVRNFFDQENLNIVVDQFEKRRIGQEQPYTVTLLRKDGTDLHTLVTPAVVYDENEEFSHSIAVVSDISEQVKAHRLLDMRMSERTQEISALMEVSRILVSPLAFEDQLTVILENLRKVTNFDGSSVLLRKENQLIAETFQIQIKNEIAEKLIQPFMQPDLVDTRFWQNGALIFPDVRSQSEDARDFFRLTESILGTVPPEIVSWIGIPIESRGLLIGVLSAHAARTDFFKPGMVELMQAFANQIAIVFENNRLYQQARKLAAADERDRLARELHDSVTQSLYSVRLYAEAVRSALAAGKIPAADKNLDQLISIARDGMGDLRLLIFELKPPVLEELGLVGALRKRLEMVESRAGIQSEFNVQGEPKLSQDIETQIYWIVYEALSNVLKHSHAKNISLRFIFSNGRSTVTLRDDGIGFDRSRLDISESSGLKNIIDRVENLGGIIQINSKPGEGTTIRIELEDMD
jgi:PAS domain S-box-containing protein